MAQLIVMTIAPDVPVAFGRWLKRLRSQQNFTQEALAEAVYCSVQLIRFWEGGRRRPSLEMAERLADVLQVPADQRVLFIQQARLPVEEVALPVAEEAGPSPADAVLEKPSLPPLDHPLIGREGERNVLRHLLLHEQRRLVTLSGAGGMGKTHLALDVATALASHFRDGAAFVALTALPSATHLPGAVAEALHAPVGAGDPQEQVLALLAPRQLLLVLDDFAPFLTLDNGAAVQWVNRLLQQAPHVQVLVTSRERLRLSGERIFELGGLALPTLTVPPESADAVRLFVDRAQQAAGYFVLDAQNKAAVMRICQLVDGMPLGIELAAAWVRVLTPAEIADELAKNTVKWVTYGVQPLRLWRCRPSCKRKRNGWRLPTCWARPMPYSAAPKHRSCRPTRSKMTASAPVANNSWAMRLRPPMKWAAPGWRKFRSYRLNLLGLDSFLRNHQGAGGA